VKTYSGNKPSGEYLAQLLGSDYFIALAAVKNSEVVGGAALYTKLGIREDVLHFDIAVTENQGSDL
jgi:aminoglycoside 3-N-acetyltransferase I